MRAADHWAIIGTDAAPARQHCIGLVSRLRPTTHCKIPIGSWNKLKKTWSILIQYIKYWKLIGSNTYKINAMAYHLIIWEHFKDAVIHTSKTDWLIEAFGNCFGPMHFTLKTCSWSGSPKRDRRAYLAVFTSLELEEWRCRDVQTIARASDVTLRGSWITPETCQTGCWQMYLWP